MHANVVPLFRPSQRDRWLDALEDELWTLLVGLPGSRSKRKLPPEARAWRAVARVLMARELGCNEFGDSYRESLWNVVEAFADRRVSGATLRAVLRRVDLLASERPLRATGGVS